MRNKKGFTLIELMVAMGIIAVLVAMAIIGITIVQRSLRNTQRRDVLHSLQLGIEAYFTNYGSYPAAGTGGVVFHTGSIEINGNTITQLKGATTGSTTATNDGATQYCYSTSGGGYKLGANLEDNAWGLQLGNLGTSQVCNTANTVVP